MSASFGLLMLTASMAAGEPSVTPYQRRRVLSFRAGANRRTETHDRGGAKNRMKLRPFRNTVFGWQKDLEPRHCNRFTLWHFWISYQQAFWGRALGTKALQNRWSP